MGNPFPVSLPAESRKATKIIQEFTSADRVDQVVPASILARAKGFAIFSVFRIGFLMSARAGSGVVVARLPDGSWSPPAAIGLGGLGGGFNAGAEVTDFLIVLVSRRAVSMFMATGSLQLGGNMALALGPLGRAAEAGGSVSSTGKLAALLSYSKSKGLYGGISLEGTILLDRADANAKAYGTGITSKDILGGKVNPPDFTSNLVDVLNRVSGRPIDADGFHEDDSSLVTPTSSASTYGNAGYGGGYGAGYGAAGTRSTAAQRDPFGDSDSEQDYGAPRAAVGRPDRYTRDSALPPARTGGHWVNAHSGEARNINERRRHEEMDAFDREIQAPSRYSPGGGGHGAQSSHYNWGSSAGGGRKGGADLDDSDLRSAPAYRPRGQPSYVNRNSAAGASQASPAASGGADGNNLVMAKFAYQPAGQADTDLSFAAGDVIRVTKRTATRDDWWAGECHGNVGYFPANYTVDL